jgi:hypothetical protein
MRIGSFHLKISIFFLKIITCIIPMMVSAMASRAQDKRINISSYSFPPGYYNLKNSVDKMRFLEKTIADSLNNGQLTNVYDWASVGLGMAEVNKQDTMRYFLL